MTSASVKSIDSIREFRTALIVFMQRVTDAVETMKEQVFHASAWIENDRPRYWHQQELTAFDGVSQARIALETGRMRKEVADFRPSLIEEKQALRKAKERLAYCQEKVREVKSITIRVRHEADEFQGRMTQLERLLETDLPGMIAVLDQMLRALEAYAEVRAKPDGE